MTWPPGQRVLFGSPPSLVVQLMVRPPASMLPCLAMRRTGSSACANTGASAPNSTMAATAVNVFIANLPFTFCSVDAAAQVSSIYLYDQGTLVAIRCVIGILLARALRG